MFNIKKKEAREFQRKGLPQEEVLEAALDRCQAAIIDQSKKSKTCVEVVVFDLDEKSFENSKALSRSMSSGSRVRSAITRERMYSPLGGVTNDSQRTG